MPVALLSIAVPTAGQCLLALAPFAAFFLMRWLLRGIDRAIHRLFPTLEWQRQLGWLNIRAERRANAVLRGLEYAVQGALAVALFGIAWGSIGLRLLPHWDDPDVLSEIDLRLPVLGVGLGLCLLYFGGTLLPRLRREYEHDELAAFRAEWAALDPDERPESRLASAAKSPVLRRPRSQR